MSICRYTANLRIAVIIFLFGIMFISSADKSEAVAKLCGYITSDSHDVTFAKVLVISDGDTLSYLTDGNGYYHVRASEIPVKTNVTATGESILAPFTLSQNYPNPFNPSTIIEYKLTSTAHVNLTILNILGQHIRSLVNESKSQGNHSIIWDGRDDNGNFASSGIYLYRMEADSNVQTKKMLLLDSGGGRSPSLSTIMQKPSAVLKTTVESFVEFEIVIMKEGYETYREFITSPADQHEIRKDITLTQIHYTEFTEDYYPLKVGNSWSYIDKSLHEDEDDDEYVAAWDVTITDTTEVDGETYYIFDKWPDFIPVILHDEEIEPLLRIADNGDYILKYQDIELILFNLSVPEFTISYNLYEYFSENSEYYNNNPEKLDRFIEEEISFTTDSLKHSAYGISGIYDGCRAIVIGEKKQGIYGNHKNTLYLSPDIGPVCFMFDDRFLPPFINYVEDPRNSYLKNASVNNIHYGTLPGTALSDTLTNADIAEIINQTLFEWLLTLFDNGYPTKSNFILSTDNIPDISLINSPITDMTLTLMDQEAILDKARNEGKFLYLRIFEFEISDDCVQTSIFLGVTPIDCFVMGDCGGLDITIKFVPKVGMWERKTIGWGIYD